MGAEDLCFLNPEIVWRSGLWRH